MTSVLTKLCAWMPKLYTLDPQKETHVKLGVFMCAGIIRYLRKVIQDNPDAYQKSVLKFTNE